MARKSGATDNASSGVDDSFAGGTDNATTSSFFGDGNTTIDPVAIEQAGGGGEPIAGATETGEPKRRRGRKPGSKNRASSTSPRNISAEGIERLLLSIHAGISTITKTPELMLEKEEANNLAVCTANVARHYDLGQTEKAMDWTSLFIALGAVYGTRVIAISIKKKQNNNTNQSGVVNFSRTTNNG